MKHGNECDNMVFPVKGANRNYPGETATSFLNDYGETRKSIEANLSPSPSLDNDFASECEKVRIKIYSIKHF